MNAVAPSKLEIQLLGRFDIQVAGHVLPETAISGRKARSLLKLLALQRHGRIVRDQAMETLWPDLDEDAAASQLYKALHHIRKAFESEDEDAADWLAITDGTISLVPPGGTATDVRRFEESARSGLQRNCIPDLEMAVSAYAGDLLPTDLYAEWISLPREHYRQLYLDVLTTLAQQYEKRGALSEAAQMLRLALEKDPALESAHRALMRIFTLRGQPTRAFRQYDLCREVLHRELAIGPSAMTKEVLEHARERRLLRTTDTTTVPATSPAPMTPIVGRSAECAEIEQSLDRLSNGEGATLVISGGMGLGKTRLIQELALRTRRRGFHVYTGSANEGRGTIAYGPFVELLDAVLHERPDLQELLPAELGQLVPNYSGDGAPVAHADKLASRGYLFAQVHRFFSRLAEDGPVVAILEDLHAADEGSQELFSYLSRHGDALSVLFAATTRAAGPESGHPGEMLHQALHQEPSVLRLDINPLTSEEHACLLRQHAPGRRITAETNDRIYRLSEGNPLFALELLQFDAEADLSPARNESNSKGSGRLAPERTRIPPSLNKAVMQRLGRLSPMARHLLYIAAAIGRHIRYELMAAAWSDATSSEENEVFDPLEEVARAQLLEERGLDYSFRHVLVRDAVYQSISGARRRTLHELIARQLVALSPDPEDEPVEQIAYHFIQANEYREGVHYLMRAGENAEAAYAHEDALEMYREALSVLATLDDTPARRLRRDVLERVGDAYRACGRLEQGYDAYEEAAGIAEELPLSTPNLVELHRKIALVAIFRTEMHRSEEHLGRAFELVGTDKYMRARLLIIKALHLWHVNQLEEAYEVARQALSMAEAVDAPAVSSQACEILAMTCLPLGRWDEGLSYEMQRQVHGWSPDIAVATDAHLCLWEYHVGGDQPYQQAQEFLQNVAEQAEMLGDMRCVAVCHYALGTMHLWRGESREAVEELDASLELHERVGSPAGKAYVLARKGVLHTMRGAMELGWQSVQEGMANARQAAVRDHCLQRLYGVGIWNRLEADDLATTARLIEESAALLDETGACAACALELYPWQAYFYLHSGEISHARACGDAVFTLAEMTGNPIGEAVASMIESSLCAAEQDEDRALEHRQKAFELAENTVTEATHSPVVHYLDRMVDQQAALRNAHPKL